MTTYNSEAVLERCLNSIAALDYVPLEVIIVDNASTDETRRILDLFEDRFRLIYNQENRGFAGGQNQAIRAADADWLVSLNPDVLVTPDFLTELICRGRLTRTLAYWPQNSSAGNPARRTNAAALSTPRAFILCAICGILIAVSEEPDHGQYERREYVFGATGAAAAYRSEMIADVSVNGEFFDEDFFAFREDADLSWRAQLMGWKCLYVPAAVAWHVRRVTPERFHQLPLVINWHSVKNRFLMRAKKFPSGYTCDCCCRSRPET